MADTAAFLGETMASPLSRLKEVPGTYLPLLYAKVEDDMEDEVFVARLYASLQDKYSGVSKTIRLVTNRPWRQIERLGYPVDPFLWSNDWTENAGYLIFI